MAWQKGLRVRLDECGRKMDDCKCKIGQTNITSCRESFEIKLDVLSCKNYRHLHNLPFSCGFIEKSSKPPFFRLGPLRPTLQYHGFTSDFFQAPITDNQCKSRRIFRQKSQVRNTDNRPQMSRRHRTRHEPIDIMTINDVMNINNIYERAQPVTGS